MAGPSTVRMPLADGNGRVNTSPTPPAHKGRKHRHASSASSAGFPPHHDSLLPGAPLASRNMTEVAPKRITAPNPPLDPKRISQISSTPTNATAHGRRKKTHIGPWELGADVGKGGCGKVRKVRHKVTGQEAAAKIISKRIAESARAESLASLVESSRKSNAGALAAGANIIPFGIEREVVIMKLLKHPNVVQLFDVWENRNELYLIMEYVSGGELFSYIEEREYLDEDEAVYLFRQMVAALLHCHRLGIHHRDLKPENILLEQHTRQVKLVDFGMAALQPRGKLLTTPCGSVHYAAPEVFKRSYDGSKVDVWSLGIILHVMLTGCTPFYYDPRTMNKDIRIWHEVIKTGDFPMDENLSAEAQDLLLRMLTPSPKERISMEEVWHHHFIHKHEQEWGESAENNDIQKWIGTAPIIESWDIHSSADIDREILRNLRTLWHSEKEEVIVKRLLNDEPNQEKYFYAALQKYREEQLESYLAGTDGANFVTNDHHVATNNKASKHQPLVTTKSQFSILNNEHLSRSTLPERPISSASYDPYRASRGPVTIEESNYLNVTVHGHTSRHSLTKSQATSKRRPVSRLETLRGEGRRSSRVSSSASLRPSSIAPSVAGSRHSGVSRHSLVNSVSKSSLSRSVIVVPVVHKRGVDFGHMRRSSTASALPTPNQKKQRPRSKRATKHESSPNMAARSSPPAAGIVVKSRKEGRRPVQPRPIDIVAEEARVKKRRTDSQIIATEARQVSTELEKFCQEVFYRNSTDLSDHTSSTSHAQYESPPSSLSKRGSFTAANTGKPIMTPMTIHAKPRPATETPNTFVTRELLETRRRLAEKYGNDETLQTEAYHDLVSHLDSLLQPGTAFVPDTKRTASDGNYMPHLPVISEEGRSELDDSRTSQGQYGKSYHINKHQPLDPYSIRTVAPSSPPQIRPLVIRKNSSDSGSSKRSDESGPGKSGIPGGQVKRKPTPPAALVLGTITEEDRSTTAEQGGIPLKKENWFKRRFKNRDVSNGSRERSWEDLDDRQQLRSSPTIARSKRSPAPGPMSPASADSAHEANKVLRGKRPGFLRFFSRKSKQSDKASTDEDTGASSSNTLVSSNNTRRDGPSQGRMGHTIDPTELTHPGDLGVSQNWLARFLNIRPATRTLCFNCGRGRTRQELVRLLRKWKDLGIRDVLLDRPRNLIFARLDGQSTLAKKFGLKEVSFVVEMYVMLERGRRANLSIARFTQRKGAASSFRRIIEAAETSLGQMDLLVKDEEMNKEMESVLVGVRFNDLT